MSYICEKCGKVTEEKFGSGRFCSRACANARTHSAETKEKIRRGILKQTNCSCNFCGKVFTNLTARASHERLCSKNPDSLDMSGNLKSVAHQAKLLRPVTLYTKGSAENIRLDITYGELELYKDTHSVCEICGKAVSEVTKWESKYAVKNLCIDHDHTTGKFRGLLCQICNRQLGWYENNKENIQKYLDK